MAAWADYIGSFCQHVDCQYPAVDAADPSGTFKTRISTPKYFVLRYINLEPDLIRLPELRRLLGGVSKVSGLSVAESRLT